MLAFWIPMMDCAGGRAQGKLFDFCLNLYHPIFARFTHFQQNPKISSAPFATKQPRRIPDIQDVGNVMHMSTATHVYKDGKTKRTDALLAMSHLAVLHRLSSPQALPKPHGRSLLDRVFHLLTKDRSTKVSYLFLHLLSLPTSNCMFYS